MGLHRFRLTKLNSWIKLDDWPPFLVAVAGLLGFIILYPKIPLYSPLENYIVRIRWEDVLLVSFTLWWLFNSWPRKLSLPTRTMGLIAAYIFAGGASLLFAIFIQGTIPLIWSHIFKSVLHWARYMEYFLILFLVYSAVKTKLDLKRLVWVIVITSVLANLYGIGQKHWQWPVYSTMNQEYSKGVPLVLQSPYARVQSTFGGHYDYGAYLVLLTPLTLALFFSVDEKKPRYYLALAYGLNLWGLMVSASRTGVAGAVLGLSLVIVLLSYQSKFIAWLILAAKRLIVVYLILGVFLLLFGQNLSALIRHTLKGIIPETSALSWLIEDETLVDQYTTPVPRDQIAPPDVYENQPELIEVVIIDETGQAQTILEPRPREYSECAQTRGLSLCIRLEALWPQAWEGFIRYPLLGSGYATLNKKDKYHFTQADGTDNNYLRILGETGIVGFVSYFVLVGYICWIAIKLFLSKAETYEKTLAVSFIAGTLGLLVNAITIDVFASSKVAFTFWALAGLMLAAANKHQMKT